MWNPFLDPQLYLQNYAARLGSDDTNLVAYKNAETARIQQNSPAKGRHRSWASRVDRFDDDEVIFILHRSY
jgi:hypothetical protein